jgi:hypothetical protein
MQNLHQSVWDHEILYDAGTSSKDEHLLIRQLFVKNQIYECGGWLKVKINALFYGNST